MPNWSWQGILFTLVIFFGLLAVILSMIHVINPVTGAEDSIISWLLGKLF